ncbi:cytochrome P450 [Streptomyces hygroscopicus]|nr:cytochrome P450 [Streptomyces hygroscopicus]
MMLIAGYEPTGSFISNAVFSLLSRPDQLELPRKDPELAGRGLEELLRHAGPGILVVRFANEDVEIGPYRSAPATRCFWTWTPHTPTRPTSPTASGWT